MTARQVPTPKFVSDSEMLHLKNSSQIKTGKATRTGGLVKTEFALEFDELSRQWKSEKSGARNMMRFQGGVVHLQITIGVYLLHRFKPKKGNPDSEDLFSVIMEHELIHVADDIDIVSNWLPPRVRQDRQVIANLDYLNPIVERSYNHWIKKRKLEQWILKGPWAQERNRRQQLRDSKEEYGKVQDELASIESRHALPKHVKEKLRKRQNAH